MMKKIKDNNRLKASIFFGFYFFFFLFLLIYIKNNNVTFNRENSSKNSENITIRNYSIDYLKDDYEYEFVVNNNGVETRYKGTKNNIDYENFENKYFFNIYNINQIIKNGKFLNSENNVLNYEISNITLSSLCDIELVDGISKINVYVDNNRNLEKVIMDLSTLMKKEKYIISLDYKVGEKSE